MTKIPKPPRKLPKKAASRKNLEIVPASKDLQTRKNLEALNMGGLSAAFKNLQLPQEELKNAFAEMMKPNVELAKQIQKELLFPAWGIQNQIKSLFDATDVFRTFLSSNMESLKAFEGLVIDLPKHNISKALNTSTHFRLQLESSITLTDSIELSLNGQVSETHKRRQFSVSTKAEFSLKLEKLEREVENNGEQLRVANTKIDELQGYVKEADSKLMSLADYIKSNGSTNFVIKSVRYNRRETTILLNGKEIKLRGNTNQDAVCHIILGNEDKLRSRWDMVDVIRAFGEDPEDKDHWTTTIREAVRGINVNIGRQTGVHDLLLATATTVEVNPKYLK